MPARPLLEAPAPAPAIAITIPVRLIGIVMLAIVVAVMAALASWSVDDPSLSYAASKPVANWLGFPGAVIADLSFQVLGLGIIVLLIPPACWGWSFVRRRVPSRLGLRLVAWLATVILATGVLAFLPAPASWPLPTGLGGLVGSGFTRLAALVTGEHPQRITAWLFAVILVAPTLALFWTALGVGAINLPTPASRKKRGQAPADEPERNGILDVLIGALVHLGFSAAAALRRAMTQARENAAARREADAAEWRTGSEPRVAGAAPEVSLGADARREPALGIDRRYTAASEPAIEDDYPPEDDADIEIAPARPARIVAPAKRPAPGARAAREAQPSLLETESGFELPALNLLSEAKHRGLADEHRPERL
ncbi:MAG TPA: DNA translocase FtsK 4TM domain-containing protein, partial [Devosia sp.]|nr:DNA translocase FtsK 4TM domain-containing protein [Devosia sp.]